MSDSERAGFILVGVCPTCSEIRVRSKILITSPAECKPENFDGVGDAPAPTGDVPLCHVCTAVLKFTKEESLAPKRENVVPIRQRAQEPVNTGPVPGRPGTPETLFEVQGDETVLNIIPDSERSMVVLTNRRIVRVRI